MKTYIVKETVYYSGSEAVTYEIDAENEDDAERKAENKDVSDLLTFYDPSLDTEDIKIKEKPYRCKDTIDMFD